MTPPTDDEITSLATDLLSASDLAKAGEIAHEVLTVVWRHPSAEAFLGLVTAVIGFADECGDADHAGGRTLLRMAANLLTSATTETPDLRVVKKGAYKSRR